MPGAPLRVALGEYDTGFHQPAESLGRAHDCVARAAECGARLVVLPEMCPTGFTMNPEDFAELEGGASYVRVGEMAQRHRVWIIAGIATRRGDDFYNVAAVFDAQGKLAGTYDKQRLFAYGEEHEHYSAGAAPLIVTIDDVRVAPFICYDLRFPELFRAVARDADLLVVIANWPAARRAHWDVLLRARAIENLACVAGVNRLGSGGGLTYDGGSAGYDPWGNASAQRPAPDAPLVMDVSADEVHTLRERYPFLADLERRPL